MITRTFPNVTLLTCLRNLGIAAMLSVTVVGFAQPVFQDDFESYGSDVSAMNLVWPDDSTGAASGIPQGTGGILTNGLSIVPPLPGGTNSIVLYYAHQANNAVIPTVTAATPCLFTWYQWKSNTVSSGQFNYRQYARIGPNNFGGSSVGAGTFNNATGPVNGVHDAFDATTYQGYNISLGTGSDALFNLRNPGCPRRTVGWHKFDVERLADGSQRYYVDNVLGREITNASSDFTYIVLGFRTASTTPNNAGDPTAYDGIRVTTNNPSVTTQPTNQLVAAGATATFTVAAASPVDFPITGYQWYFATNLNTTNNIFAQNYQALAGQNSSTLTINNAQSTNQGIYFVVVSNSDSYVGSAAATLSITVPSILSQPPTNQTVLQGGNFNATLTAGGATPLKYQWYFNGTTIVTGATTNKLTKTAVQPSDAGDYTCRVTNTFGAVTSGIATLIVVSNPHPTAMSLLWSKLPGSYPWLNTDGTQRGLAYNSLSNHVLVVSRTGSSLVHVLDADTGGELYTLDASGITGGGTFDINMVAVADDGAVYVGNLTLDGVGTHYKLYRYSDDGPTTVATVALDDDPGAGASDRWGDTIAVRGEGAATQVLLTSRGNGAPANGTNACILTTADGINFTVNVIHTDTTNMSDLGMGVAFGLGDTFWAKSNDGTTKAFYHFAFNIAANSATTLKTYTNLSAGVANIGANRAGSLLAGIAIETPNDLRLYDTTVLATDPVVLDWEFFTPNNAGQATGNAVFGNNNRLYALNSNNGLLAMQITWPPLTINQSGTNVVLGWPGGYKLQKATAVNGAYLEVIGATSPYTNAISGGQAYFRLEFP